MGADPPDGPGDAGESSPRAGLAGSSAAVDAAVETLSRLFLADHSFAWVLQRVVDSAVAVLPGVLEASVTVLPLGGEGATVASSGLLAYELDETQYLFDDGPCLTAATSGGPVLVLDTTVEVRWPVFSRRAQDRGACSILALPVPLPLSVQERAQRRRRVRAALNLYAADCGVFDHDTLRSCERFTAGAATVVANMRFLTATQAMVDGLVEASEARTLIEQAKGMIMARAGCTADEAFTMLSAASQRTQRKVRDLAADMVSGRGQLD